MPKASKTPLTISRARLLHWMSQAAALEARSACDPEKDAEIRRSHTVRYDDLQSLMDAIKTGVPVKIITPRV